VSGSVVDSVSILLGRGDGTFEPHVEVATGPSPHSAAIVDLNGDGHADLAVANAGSGTISVFLGDGSGRYSVVSEYAAGATPGSLQVADFDSNGRPDLAVTNGVTNTLSVLIGLGDGTFGARTEYPVGPSPFSIAVGDLNQDGHADLVSADYGTGELVSESVSVLLGRGDGTFGPRRAQTTAPRPKFVAIADLNGDGRQDLLVNSGRVEILYGRGDGSFDAGTEVAQSGSAGIGVGDLDGDGRLDLVLSGVTVLLARGDGTFGPGIQTWVPGSSNFVTLADLNGDGRNDVVVPAGSAPFAVRTLLGNGDGTFGHAILSAEVRSVISSKLADLDGDGKLDLVLGHDGSLLEGISVLLGDGKGAFARGAGIRAGFDFALGDLDGDARADLAVVSPGEDSLAIFLGNGDGTFRASGAHASGRFAGSPAIGDLNGDSIPDVAVVSRDSPGSALLFMGRGAGDFAPPVRIPVGSSPDALAVSDLNGDGRKDLVVLNGTVSVLLGLGNGNFSPPLVTAAGYLPSVVRVADLDGDSHPDVIVTSNYEERVLVLIGRGDGTFAPAREYPVHAGPPRAAAIDVADVDLDGHPDLAVADKGLVSILPGRGDGTFTKRLDFGVGQGGFVALGDLDGDSRPDLVSNTFGDSVVALLNRGSRTPIWIEDLAATAGRDGVLVSWTRPRIALAGIAGIAVQRAEVWQGPYDVRTDRPLGPAGPTSFLDPTVGPGRCYWYRLSLLLADGGGAVVGPVSVVAGAGGAHRTALQPLFENSDGAPIPIRYALAGFRARVRLAVYDVRGREVWASSPTVQEAGEHLQLWNRLDRAGGRVARGTYLVRLQAGSTIDSGKLVLVHR
jgi:hypothetical protein